MRMETIAATNDRPADMTFVPEERDMAWVKLYTQNKGKIDANFGKLAFGKPPLASRNSCDAKYTTADMALKLQSFAHWADPYGQLWEPSDEVLCALPDAAPIVPNDWAVMTTVAPAVAATQNATALTAVDFENDEGGGGDDEGRHHHSQSTPAWHGGLFCRRPMGISGLPAVLPTTTML